MKSVNIFLGADLRLGHDGLRKLAKSKNVLLSELNRDEAVIFINSARDKIKSYSWNGVVSYMRSKETNRPIDLMALDYLVKTFNPSGQMNYPAALRLALLKRLRLRGNFDPELLGKP